jgi:hypothetical protein
MILLTLCGQYPLSLLLILFEALVPLAAHYSTTLLLQRLTLWRTVFFITSFINPLCNRSHR